MIFGIGEIQSNSSYGIPMLHLRAIIEAAHEQQVVIGIRPVSSYAKPWIEQGAPTKSFVIKNKTCRHGPCQGLIAINPQLGRINDSPSTSPGQSRTHASDNKQKEYETQLQYAFEHDSSLKPIPLVLTKEVMNTLKDVTITQSYEPHCYNLTWQNEHGQLMKAEAYQQEETYHILDDEGDPIMVLGKTIMNEQGEHEERPITADYDLLVVCPSYRDFSPGKGKKDHTPLRTQSFNSEMLKKAIKSEQGRRDSPQEDTKGGNWSGRVQEVVTAINSKISHFPNSNRGVHTQGLETVHHNAEFSNPFASSLSSSLPATIVFPQPMDMSTLSGRTIDTRVECVVVETVEDLNILRNYVKEQGYYWPANANLNTEVPVFDPKVKEVGAQMVRKLSQRSLFEPLQKENQPNSENISNKDEVTPKFK